MLVVLDTNVIFDDPLLEKASARAARDAQANLGFRLIVPEVVFDECVQKFNENTAEAVGKFKEALKNLHTRGLAQGVVAPAAAAIQQANDSYQGHLSQLFPIADRLPYPPDGHNQVAARAMSKRRPFIERDRGYRDTLIWLAVLQAAQATAEGVALISADSGFRQKESNDLHSDLIEDLRATQIEPNRIRLYRDLGQFVGNFVLPQLAVIQGVRQAIEFHQVPALQDLDDQVETLLNESLYEVQFGSYKEPDYLYVDVIEGTVLSSVDEVRRLPSGEIFARTTWTCEVAPESGTYLPYQSGPSGEYIAATATVDLVLNPATYEVVTKSIASFDVEG